MRLFDFIVIALSISYPCFAFGQQEITQPNILLIYVDDLGYGDLASFGHPVIKTPNLDALADKGLRLTNYYAPSALCSPSRAGLLTGRHPYRTGIETWIPEGSGIYLHTEEVTLAEVLASVGYQTALSSVNGISIPAWVAMPSRSQRIKGSIISTAITRFRSPRIVIRPICFATVRLWKCRKDTQPGFTLMRRLPGWKVEMRASHFFCI